MNLRLQNLIKNRRDVLLIKKNPWNLFFQLLKVDSKFINLRNQIEFQSFGKIVKVKNSLIENSYKVNNTFYSNLFKSNTLVFFCPNFYYFILTYSFLFKEFNSILFLFLRTNYGFFSNLKFINLLNNQLKNLLINKSYTNYTLIFINSIFSIFFFHKFFLFFIFFIFNLIFRKIFLLKNYANN